MKKNKTITTTTTTIGSSFSSKQQHSSVVVTNYNCHSSMNRYIRKRPVSFGNPVLATYNGYIYTYQHDYENDNDNHTNDDYFQNNNNNNNNCEKEEVQKDHKNIHNNNPISNNTKQILNTLTNHLIQQSSTTTTSTSDDDDHHHHQKQQQRNNIVDHLVVPVEHVVAMVNVPPEQVPEGILNFARCHRSNMEHVRIVMSRSNHNNNTTTTSTFYPTTTTTTTTTNSQHFDNQLQQKSFENEKDDEEEGSTMTSIYHDTTTGSAKEQPLPLSPSVMAAQNAAFILLVDEEKQKIQQQQQHQVGENRMNNNNNNNNDIYHNNRNHNFPMNHEQTTEQALESLTSSSYIVLFQLNSYESANLFVQDLHKQPYTILNENEIAHVYHVLAFEDENEKNEEIVIVLDDDEKEEVLDEKVDEGATSLEAVSFHQRFVPSISSMIMSPFFSNGGMSGSSNNNHIDNSTGSSLSRSVVVQREQPTKTKIEKPIKSSTTTTYKNTKTTTTTNSMIAPPVDDSYNCAVCLETIDVQNYNRPSSTISSSLQQLPPPPPPSIVTTVCNHTFHLDCLLQWQDSPCPVCRYDHSGLNETLSQCHICGTTENNFVCLICGVISCGGGSIGTNHPMMTAASATTTTEGGGASGTGPFHTHARCHYDETLHTYALNTETQHVWDFAGQGYVHRLLHNKDDGKIVEMNDPNHIRAHNNHHHHYHAGAGPSSSLTSLTSASSGYERIVTPGLSDRQEDEVVHRKLEGYANQYYTLLQSQLSQQRLYYEKILNELRSEYQVNTTNNETTNNNSKVLLGNRDSRKQIPLGGSGTNTNQKNHNNNHTKNIVQQQQQKRTKKVSTDLIHALKQERNQLKNRYNVLQNKCTKMKKEIDFLVHYNDSLEQNQISLLEQYTELQKKRTNQRILYEQQILPPLEEMVTKLMLQLEN